MDEQPPGTRDQSGATDGPLGCYRHPGRETGIRCTRCDRPICTECMVSASVGFQCPDCVRQGSGTGHGPAANQPRTLAGGTIAADPRLVTKILLALNVALFIVVHVKGAAPGPDALRPGQPLLRRPAGRCRRGPVVPAGHGDVPAPGGVAHRVQHAGTVVARRPLEAALGRARYLALYLLSGLAGSALTYWLAAPNQPSLGASGAIFGLLGATAVLMRRLNYDMRPVLVLLALNLLFTFTWGGIAWQAHVGGLIAGTVIAIAMVHAPRGRRALVQYGTCALVLAAVILVVVARTAALT